MMDRSRARIHLVTEDERLVAKQQDDSQCGRPCGLSESGDLRSGVPGTDQSPSQTGYCLKA
jgi:hypothetical protein